jgi:Topoisomerase DNA binding C4 zinc finger
MNYTRDSVEKPSPPQAGSPAFVLSGICPRCGSRLVVRYAHRTDEPFVGCVGYPNCRFTERFNTALQDAIRHLEIEHEACLEEIARWRHACDYWQAMAKRASAGDRDLKNLLTLAHPDRWSQGQLAEELAHEMSVAINNLRKRLEVL